MTGTASAPMRAFLDGLAAPPGRDRAPVLGDAGWDGPAGTVPYLSYIAGGDGFGWSAELEEMHSDSTGEHFIDTWTREGAILAFARGASTAPKVVADLGCSSGYLLSDLRDRYPSAALVGLDSEATGLAAALERVPGAALFQASATELPFGDASLDAVFALNLLEHLPEDTAALAEIRRVLRPGGRAVVIVPWNNRLYDYYDAHLKHERRYARGELAAKALRAGLSVESTSYLGSLVYPGFWAVKKRNRLMHRGIGDDHARDRVAAHISTTQRHRLADVATRVERGLLRRGVRIPVGIRELTVVARPDPR